MQNIVTETEQDAKVLIDYLRQKQAGPRHVFAAEHRAGAHPQRA